MAVHAILVRIDYDNNYSTRYAETVAAIRKEAAAGTVWDEATSTYVLKSAKAAQALCDAIYYAAPLYESKDTLVVINLSAKDYGIRGVKMPATLASLMAAR